MITVTGRSSKGATTGNKNADTLIGKILVCAKVVYAPTLALSLLVDGDSWYVGYLLTKRTTARRIKVGELRERDPLRHIPPIFRTSQATWDAQWRHVVSGNKSRLSLWDLTITSHVRVKATRPTLWHWRLLLWFGIPLITTAGLFWHEVLDHLGKIGPFHTIMPAHRLLQSSGNVCEAPILLNDNHMNGRRFTRFQYFSVIVTSPDLSKNLLKP